MKLLKGKRGNVIILVIFIAVLFTILFLGFIFVGVSSILNYGFDILTPELTSTGQVGDSNFTDYSKYTITPLNNIVQNLTWVVGFVYILMIIGSIALAVSFRTSPNKVLIGFYVMLVFVLVIGAIFISNIYEEFYNGSDEFAQRMQEHTIASYMILYSPTLLAIIAFITGIILFSGVQQEDFV